MPGESMASTTNTSSGLWKPTQLQQLYYGSGSVSKQLVNALPSPKSKAFIITGSSLATKTGLIKQVESLLGANHAGTFADIKQHAPVAQLDQATDRVVEDPNIDTIISVGGGSPIDSAKAISYRVNEKLGKYLFHITIPTTLSAAECTMNGGYSNEHGLKIAVSDPALAPRVVIYDSIFALETPPRLWISTGFRAIDHAVELMYHPNATEIPARQMCLSAISTLFTYLPKYKQDPRNEETITHLQLGAFASLGFLGLNVSGPLGLSHVLGYALGSPYSIPHGFTSCLTLGHVVQLKAESNPADAAQIARMLPYIGRPRSGDDIADAKAVGKAILDLVESLDLKTTLKDWKVPDVEATIITKRATKKEPGDPTFEAVLGLVKGLYGLGASFESKY
ncbi:Dehydroquinate synthase-like protein [Eremomyces bilateralis CBS 781.70]|uniref:Dehydroquinate synthase-like protein n=1 Tax=Eremomyces bilateralis CBS 781.70 TaxID=1392243 RepID=A0A6G1G5L3_9PEZI|nr:Dehydroquinate synthase-like protein [Eremomyces bilateralis CBS 781.70]KAF1813344.1 Dehydroquinate synthase-like protein [Eremomyces bilateralis CBS 781.70]